MVRDRPGSGRSTATGRPAAPSPGEATATRSTRVRSRRPADSVRMPGPDLDPAAVTGTILIAGRCRAFAYTPGSRQLTWDVFRHELAPAQRRLTTDERRRIAAEIATHVDATDARIEIGRYRCPECDRWVDLEEPGAWSYGICTHCALIRGSEPPDRQS